MNKYSWSDDFYRYLGEQRDYDQGVDYLHARYYNYAMGKFMSVDPDRSHMDLTNPFSWNLYTYAFDNPITLSDPSGEKVNLTALSDEQKRLLLQALGNMTGYVYDVDEQGYLIIKSMANQPKSPTAADWINKLITKETEFKVLSINDPNNPGGANPKTLSMTISFRNFGRIIYGKVNPATFNVGTHFVHEGLHLLGLAHERQDGRQIERMKKGIEQKDDVLKIMNKIRRELGLPERARYESDKVGIFRKYERIPFWLNGRKKISYIKWCIKGCP